MTGKQEYLDAMLVAWQDIVDNRLFITGTTANGAHTLKIVAKGPIRMDYLEVLDVKDE